jgi:two-component system sensor histidine kinase AlgZ
VTDGQTGGLPRTTASLSLPNFCAAGAVLVVVLISELVAMVLTLARAGIGYDVPFWVDLARNSLFLLWIGLLSAAVLCYGRPLFARLSVARGTALALLLLLLVTAVVSELAWWADRYWAALLQPTVRPGAGGHLVYLARNLLICLIVSIAALRYFYVADQWRRNVELEAAARVNALQARIRPHFLFNSMNTIASLTRSSPALAEEAVEDLAELFRASLADADNRVSLREELEISRVYQRIEQHRLGDRLTVQWDVDALPPGAEIPSLSIQPLLENAIHHGIEPRPQGGTVRVVGRLLDDDTIEIEITNPLPDPAVAASTEGNRMALQNIRERFRLAWPGRAAVESGRAGDGYRVCLRFPAREGRSRSARPLRPARSRPDAPRHGEPVA